MKLNGMLYDLYENIRDEIAQEEEWENWDDTKICEELINKINEIKEGYVISEEEKEKILKELREEWEKEDYEDYLKKSI